MLIRSACPLVLASAALAQCNVSSTTSLTDAFISYGNPQIGAAAPAGGAWSFFMGQPGGTPLIGVQSSALPVGLTWYGRPETAYFIPTVGALYSPDPNINQNPFYDRTPRFTGLMMHPGNSQSEDSIAVFTAQLPTTIMAMTATVDVLGDLSNGVNISLGDVTGGVRHEGAPTLVPFYPTAPVAVSAALSAPLSLAAGESVFIRVDNAGSATEDWSNIDFVLTLRGGPNIVAPPRASSACINHAAEIRILAAGSGPIHYQWRHNGSTLSNDGHYASVNSNRLQITSLRADDAGNYDCIVTGPCGTLTSVATDLEFCTGNFNCDGAVDFFDYLDFVNAFAVQDPLSDFNADGAIDFFDYLDFVNAFAQGC